MFEAFEIWRRLWLQTLDVSGPWGRDFDPAALTSAAPDVSALPALGRLRLELPTMALVEQRAAATGAATPVLIVAPYAIHDASIADFAPGHSLAEALQAAGTSMIAATFWKSATPQMSQFGIDAYLADLNIAIDELGGEASLVGLCQGGWLAALYAARFPRKVRRLVLVGAPVDLAAAPSTITRALELATPASIRQAIALSGGLVRGSLSLALTASGMAEEYRPEAALGNDVTPELAAKFSAWSALGMDLPGAYFVQTAEWLFRQNRFAEAGFPALGRLCRLADLRLPIFVLAAEDDSIVPAPQATAALQRCPDADVTLRVVPGRHLSLFMGARTLKNHWPQIAHWICAQGDARSQSH